MRDSLAAFIYVGHGEDALTGEDNRVSNGTVLTPSSLQT
jgi:hypothetical protein